MVTKKKPEVYTCLWYYSGGRMMKEVGSEKHIDSFAKSIRHAGGSATIYKGRV